MVPSKRNTKWFTDISFERKGIKMKNKNIILLGQVFKGLAIVLVAVSMAILLSSCGKAAEKAATAVIIDKGANSQLADGAAECLKQACDNTLKGGGHLTIIGASSHPQIICDRDVKEPGNSSKTALESRWEKDASFTEARGIDGWKPHAEEVDLLKAFKLAGDALHATDCANRTIYVASPGTSSSGLFDLTGSGPYGDLLAWDFDELVSRIAKDTSSGSIEAEGLPDLAGIRIVWMGFGQITGGSQAEIPPDRIAQLKDLWTRLLVACGADFSPSDFINCPVSEIATDHSKLPKVTPIIFEETLGMHMVTFDESVLAFNPNEATYRDGDAYAKTILAPYADSLVQTKQKIVVLGTTAKEYGKEGGARDLGRQRAERVKEDLVELGVGESQITVCSAGFEGVDVRVGGKTVSFYTENYNTDGSWNESAARTNRAIHLINENLAGDVIARFSV